MDTFHDEDILVMKLHHITAEISLALLEIEARHLHLLAVNKLIELLAEEVKKMDADFISGGERRDFFFSMPVAKKLGLGHLSIFKDLSCVYTDENGVSMDPAEANLAGKKSVHIADLITVASSYIRAWIPAVEALGAKIAYSLAVVDRDQGGSEILEKAGCPLTTLITIKPELFEQAKQLGRVTDAQIELVNSFIADPDKFLHDFLVSHPDFLAGEIAKGGKSAQRAELCIASGFAPECALPKK